MRRRGVGLLMASVMALGMPGRLGAQAPRRLPVIGVLGAGTEATWAPWTEAFLRRLEELGWTDGRSVAIAYRWAQGRNDAIASITAEFVRIPVDVIVTVGGAAQIAMRSTSTVPIVFAIAVEPVGIGLVASLSRPGGNLTGLSLQGSDLAGKRIEILREAVPGLRRIAIIANTGSAANVIEVREARNHQGRSPDYSANSD
jgi:putative ABC transport system substrate-binding protein